MTCACIGTGEADRVTVSTSIPPFVIETEAVNTRMLAAETVVAVLAECHMRRVDTQKPDGAGISASGTGILSNHGL